MRTEEKLQALLAQLQANCGDLFAACNAVGLTPLFVKQWRRDDPKVDTAITDATHAGAMRIESEAIRRAVEGVEKGVWYKGEEVGSETVYSDGLMAKILAARVPGYDKTEGGAGNTTNIQNNGVINFMPRADTYEQWLEMQRQTENPQLPAPDEQIPDAEFTEVASSPFAGIPL
jgi:hypothetical protein